MVNNFNIAQNIRTLREERGYTIEKLAEPGQGCRKSYE